MFRPLSMAVAMCAGLAAAQASANDATNLEVCLFAHDASRAAARYRVTIGWGDQIASAGRVDLVAADSSGDVWPQFRDGRLKPSAGAKFEDFITVGDGSGYPLQFFLIGMTPSAAEQFDRSCRGAGFCSLRLPTDGVTQVGGPAARAGVASVASAPACPPRGQ